MSVRVRMRYASDLLVALHSVELSDVARSVLGMHRLPFPRVDRLHPDRTGPSDRSPERQQPSPAGHRRTPHHGTAQAGACDVT
eukprot:3290360-Rhodomonas_salina.5